MIRLVCNLENNISIIYFAFAEKSGMSFCFACVCLLRSWVVELKPKVCRGSMHTNDRRMLCDSCY